MTKKCCPMCKTEMVPQSYVDTESGEKVNQMQCFACGYSDKTTVSEEE